jgi:hypothetical protein
MSYLGSCWTYKTFTSIRLATQFMTKASSDLRQTLPVHYKQGVQNIKGVLSELRGNINAYVVQFSPLAIFVTRIWMYSWHILHDFPNGCFSYVYFFFPSSALCAQLGLAFQYPTKQHDVQWTQNSCELRKRHSKRGKRWKEQGGSAMVNSLSEHVQYNWKHLLLTAVLRCDTSAAWT